MTRVRATSLKPMAGMDVTAFTLSFVILYVLMLVAFSSAQSFHHGISSDLPRVHHPRLLPHAAREDAQIIAILRTGKLFYGNELIAVDQLGEHVGTHLREAGGERKIYIRADARAKWGRVGEVIDEVRAAGIPEVALLADQARSGP